MFGKGVVSARRASVRYGHFMRIKDSCFGFWVLVFAGVSAPAHASIVNVLQPQVGEPEEGWAVQGRVGLGLEAGNEDKQKVSVLAGARRVFGAHQTLLKASLDRATTFGESSTDRSFVHLRHRVAFAESWTGFGFAQLEHNAFRALRVRDLFGLGIERSLWKAERSEAAIATALMSEHELLLLSVESLPPRLRSSNYFLLAVDLGEGLTLGSTTFFQPQIADLSDWRLLEDLTLNVSLGERLSWSVSCKMEMDSRPPTDVNPWDVVVKTGLGWSY